MQNRAAIIDENFKRLVKAQTFPKAHSLTTTKSAALTQELALTIFKSQITSRLLDIKARELKEENQSFYTIGSSGHEGNAAIAAALSNEDMAFLHYRSGAFMVQRLQDAVSNPILDLLYSLTVSSKDPIASGRHKVFGSAEVNVPPQTSTIASHLPKALGAALSIGRAKDLKIQSKLAENSLVLCSFGDASLNHASCQTAINAASWTAYQGYPLPLIFLCEDNGIGISTPTPENWVAASVKHRPAIHYLETDGLNIADVYLVANQAQKIAREKRQPVFLRMQCVRLLAHAGSDIETQYHSLAQIESTEMQDPLLHTARIMLDNQWLSVDEIINLYQNIRQEIDAAAKIAINAPKLDSFDAVMQSIIPKKTNCKKNKVDANIREKYFQEVYPQLQIPRNLCQNINFALTDLMMEYDNIVVFGEDVAKKGGVYRVTADLVQRFGSRRVFNTLLDETTILGNAIGMAHNGFLPIPEIQFLAYYHNAEDQIRGEAATLSFFSNQQYNNPLVIRIAGLAYQKGFGGHFHNDNSIAVLRDIPGLIIACPSNGSDAAKMLRHCVMLAQTEKRIVVFLEPIALYMTKDLHIPGDNAWLCHYPAPDQQIKLNEVTVFGNSEELLIISYGNGYYLSRQAAEILKEKYNLAIKVMDLHWLAPLPEKAIIKEAKKAKNILIVDECRQTGSVSEALVTLLYESLNELPQLARLCAKDSFIPLGPAMQTVLPSCEDIVAECLRLMECNEKTLSRLC